MATSEATQCLGSVVNADVIRMQARDNIAPCCMVHIIDSTPRWAKLCLASGAPSSTTAKYSDSFSRGGGAQAAAAGSRTCGVYGSREPSDAALRCSECDKRRGPCHSAPQASPAPLACKATFVACMSVRVHGA